MKLREHFKTKQALLDENKRLRAMVEEAMRQRMLGHPLEEKLNKQLQTRFQIIQGSCTLLEVDSGRTMHLCSGDNLDIRFSELKIV